MKSTLLELKDDVTNEFIADFAQYSQPTKLFKHLESIVLNVGKKKNTLSEIIEYDECGMLMVYLVFLDACISNKKALLKRFPAVAVTDWKSEIKHPTPQLIYSIETFIFLSSFLAKKTSCELLDSYTKYDPKVALLIQKEIELAAKSLKNFLAEHKAIHDKKYQQTLDFKTPRTKSKKSITDLKKSITHRRLSKLFADPYIQITYTAFENDYDQWEWLEHPTLGEIAVNFGNPTTENENYELMIGVPKRTFYPLLLSKDLFSMNLEDSCRQYYLCPYRDENGVPTVAYRMRPDSHQVDFTRNEDLTLYSLLDYEEYYGEAIALFEWVEAELLKRAKIFFEQLRQQDFQYVWLAGTWKSTAQIKSVVEACSKSAGFKLLEHDRSRSNQFSVDGFKSIAFKSKEPINARTDTFALAIKFLSFIKALTESPLVTDIALPATGVWHETENLKKLLAEVNPKLKPDDPKLFAALLAVFVDVREGSVAYDDGENEDVVYTSGMKVFGLSDIYLRGTLTKNNNKSIRDLLLQALLQSFGLPTKPKYKFSDEFEKKFQPHDSSKLLYQPFGYRRLLIDL